MTKHTEGTADVHSQSNGRQWLTLSQKTLMNMMTEGQGHLIYKVHLKITDVVPMSCTMQINTKIQSSKK